MLRKLIISFFLIGVITMNTISVAMSTYIVGPIPTSIFWLCSSSSMICALIIFMIWFLENEFIERCINKHKDEVLSSMP